MSRYSLVGVDGNAFSVMRYVKDAMRKTGFSNQEQDDYTEKAMSGDYHDLLCLSMDMIDQCNERVGNDEED